ncbi:hypothetical protein HDU98_009199 [Podochytrium sp. JEL0797]|nr:hypothetical protein HDU98_009199 [Podochytrium sp. JEL0797]
MGNTHSDSIEKDIFNVVKFVPLVGSVYATARAGVYAGKGNDQETLNSGIVAAGGPMGALALELGEAELSVVEHTTALQWEGGRTDGSQLKTKNTFKGHLFEYSTIAPHFEKAPSTIQSLFNLFGLSDEEVKVLAEGCLSDVPFQDDGIRFKSDSDAFSKTATLTRYCLIGNASRDKYHLRLITRYYNSTNAFSFTQLPDTKKKELKEKISKASHELLESNSNWAAGI